MTLYDFSVSDIESLQRLIAEEKQSTYEIVKHEIPEHLASEQQSPEVYIIEPPLGGIPARVGNELGHAACKVYNPKRSFPSDVERTLTLVTNPDGSPFEPEVYNLSLVEITEPFLSSQREKYGTFFVEKPPNCDFIRFRILSVDTSVSPREAIVDILSRPCGCVTVPEEEFLTGTGTGERIVPIYDLAGCNLNEPEADLIGRVGYAKYMIDETYENVLSGTGTIDDCRWEIITLCCPTCP